MLVKNLLDIPSFIAGDKTILKEILHPKNDDIDLPFSIAYAEILPNNASLPHKLSGAETYLILGGKGSFYLNEEKQEIKKGDLIFVPPNALQWVENTGKENLSFYCIVNPAWSPESEVIE